MPNRVLCETGFKQVLSAIHFKLTIIHCNNVLYKYNSGSDAMLMDEDNAILRYGHQFADYLARGMGDNWSQVGEGDNSLLRPAQGKWVH